MSAAFTVVTTQQQPDKPFAQGRDSRGTTVVFSGHGVLLIPHGSLTIECEMAQQGKHWWSRGAPLSASGRRWQNCSNPAFLCRAPRCLKGKTIKKELKDAANTAEDVSNSRLFVIAARTGFVVSGLLHFLVGAIAIQLAFGKTQHADQSGAMTQLARQPGGLFLLWIGVAACAMLALWQASEAAFGYRQLKSKAKLGKKLSAVGQGIVFLVLAVAFASFALGSRKSSGQSTSDSTAQIMKAPLGSLLLIIIGAVIAVVGIVFVIRGISTSFKKKLSLPPSGTVRSIIMVFGIVGYIAKGIALFLVGLLFIIATIQARPQESTGLDGALRAVREQPYGVYLLTLIGAGLIFYGLYQIAKARYVRM